MQFAQKDEFGRKTFAKGTTRREADQPKPAPPPSKNPNLPRIKIKPAPPSLGGRGMRRRKKRRNPEDEVAAQLFEESTMTTEEALAVADAVQFGENRNRGGRGYPSQAKKKDLRRAKREHEEKKLNAPEVKIPDLARIPRPKPKGGRRNATARTGHAALSEDAQQFGRDFGGGHMEMRPHDAPELESDEIRSKEDEYEHRHAERQRKAREWHEWEAADRPAWQEEKRKRAERNPIEPEAPWKHKAKKAKGVVIKHAEHVHLSEEDMSTAQFAEATKQRFDAAERSAMRRAIYRANIHPAIKDALLRHSGAVQFSDAGEELPSVPMSWVLAAARGILQMHVEPEDMIDAPEDTFEAQRREQGYADLHSLVEQHPHWPEYVERHGGDEDAAKMELFEKMKKEIFGHAEDEPRQFGMFNRDRSKPSPLSSQTPAPPPSSPKKKRKTPRKYDRATGEPQGTYQPARYSEPKPRKR